MIKHYSATVYDCDGKYSNAKTEIVVLFKDHKEEIASRNKLIGEMASVVKAIAHISVDFGYGVFELGRDDIKRAKELTKRVEELIK